MTETYSVIEASAEACRNRDALILAAVEHAARSNHHPHCGFNKRSYQCACHVGKAIDAIAAIKAGA